MAPHLLVLAVVYFVISALGLIAALAVFGVMTGIGVIAGMREFWLFSLLGTFIGVYLLIVSLPGLILAWGLYARRSWARILGFIVAALSLLNFPVGTILGGYTIWVLTRPETELLLEAGPEATV